ncbi:MAG TPA: photosynthetic reaction center cytochrome c subunit family protein [Fimbriimonadaceae bacterium]|nr:photosynthetic reaction center cytochrome c subunit family protein [Fimbriimonadaceae bacterium]
MKKPAAAFAAIVCLAAGGLSTIQGDEPAEKIFKNIVSFKGVPAKDIMPAMKHMNASLKVDCGFCHQENDYAADHPNREITRQMIEMQKDINAKFFNGRPEVSCNTCHNGSTHPEGLPQMPGVATRHLRLRTDKTPADFFKGHLDAVGGAGPILKWTGTMTQGDNPPAPFEVVQAANGRFLATLGPLKMGHDGTATWTHDGTNVVRLWGDDAVSLARLGRTFRTPAAFEGRLRLQVAGQEKLEGRNAVVVRGGLADPTYTEELYFDQETGLLGRVVVFTRTSIGTAPTYIDYGDYRTVEGVKAPFQIRSLGLDGKVTLVKYEKAEVASGFDEKSFSPPAD